MAYTVRKLIAELKKQPQNALVCWRNHDQSPDETDGYVANVHEGEPELLAAQADALEHFNKRKIVVLGT